jgi:hypothetical protein
MADILHPPSTDESTHEVLDHLRTERPRRPRRGTDRGPDRGPTWIVAAVAVAVVLAAVAFTILLTRGGEAPESRDDTGPQTIDPAIDVPMPTARTTPPNRPRETDTIVPDLGGLPVAGPPSPHPQIVTPGNRPAATDVIVPDLGGLPVAGPPSPQPQIVTSGNRPAATDVLVPDLGGLPLPAAGAADQAGQAGSATETASGSVRCELTEPNTAC